MEEISLQEFEQILITAGVWNENQIGKWDEVISKLSCYYYYRAEEIEKKLPQTADYYRGMADTLFSYLYDHKYFDR